ncbi:PAS domain-containing protein [Fulvivirga ulvae]|uniref:PAS domain-containing protein n=1 Tax=Fulvivirga ulvae TaxID=2904245 RepID=UPI001F20E753|nr:PAS domain-containing protein [Fulvivirga ulvae]UII31119.1 PAS domain-containing protein [Fulvivirga ulvae]
MNDKENKGNRHNSMTRGNQEFMRNVPFDLLMQSPSFIAVLRGPEHIFEFANPKYMQLVGSERNIIGRRVADSIPEAKEQGFIEILDRVYITGEDFNGNEIPIKIDSSGKGDPEQYYLNFVYQPYRDPGGNIEGIFVHGVDVTEQVVSRQKIRESELKYRSLFDSINQAFSLIEVIFDANGEAVDFRYLEVNSMFDRHAVVSDPVGKTASGLIPDLEDKWFKIYGEIAKTGIPRGFVERYEKEDRWYEVYAFRHGDEGSNKVAVLFSDITERKRTEEALLHRENLMRLINDAIPAFIAYITPDRRYRFANKMYEKWYGLPKEKVQGAAIMDIIGKETYEKSRPFMDRALNGENCSFETSFMVDGEVKELEVEYVTDKDANDHVRGVVVLGHDVTVRRKAEESLRLSQMRFKTFAEAMPQMAFIADKEGNIQYYNERWYEYIGKLDNTEGWGWKEKAIHHKDDLQRTVERWRESLNTGKEYEIEYRLRRYDGEYRWHLGRAVPLYDGNKEIELWFGTNTDIHEQKKAEESLKHTRDLLYTTFDNVPSGVILFDKSGKVLFSNELGARFQGYDSVKELLAQQDIDTIKKRFGDTFRVEDENGKVISADRSVTSRILRGERNSEVIFRYYHTRKNIDGWMLVRGTPIFDDNGDVRLALISLTDITRQKKAEEALRRSEEFNRTMLESSPDWVNALDLEGRLLSVNARGLEMLEVEDFERIRGKSWLAFWEGDFYENAARAIAKAKNGDIGHFSGHNTTGNGRFAWWDVLVAPIYGAGGKVERLVAVSRDISNIKALEQQKDDFLSIASHELKTPVTSIKAYAQVLQKRFVDAHDLKSAEMLAKMDGQLNKLTGLISDLLDVTKIEQGKLQFRKEAFKINDLISEVSEEIQRTSKNHRVEEKLTENITITGDRDRIGQVLVNFLTNAIKYSPGADKVIVRSTVENENKTLVLSVEDFGLGLEEKDRQKVFDRFYRVEGTGYETYPGLGLGLYISSEIVKRHEGSVWVESKKGEGSRFYFTLPIF